MWQAYSKSYLQANRTSSLTILAAALVATLFLSLLCSLGYNFWVYEVERIVLEEGDWQGRLSGDLQGQDLALIQNFPNVAEVKVHPGLLENQTVVELRFHNIRAIYRDLPQIATQLGLEEGAAEYHETLLSRYFVHDPQDEQPPMLLTLYAVILALACLSLVLIIRNSFALSMEARVHQFGILSSIGATPRQIRQGLLQEAAVLCAVPILVGCLLGAVASFGVISAINFFAAEVPDRHRAVFQYHIAVFALTVLSSSLTVLVSAWIPARRLSKMTPLEAIRDGSGGLGPSRRRRFPLLSLLFGIEGELAGNALKAQKSALRLANLSLLLSLLGFTLMLCFTTLSSISTRFTYFERYQNAWDVMVTLRDTDMVSFDLTGELRAIPGVGDVTLYQKAQGQCQLPEDAQSPELMALGGYGALGRSPAVDGTLSVEAPIVILDDQSFLAYCSGLGVEPSLEGVIVLNHIWDSQNSNFRGRRYVPFVKESQATTCLEGTELPVLAYAQEPPVLREEYPDPALVHFIPLSLWTTLDAPPRTEEDSFIRIFSAGDRSAADLNRVQAAVEGLLSGASQAEVENRIQERLSNDRMIAGSQWILGGFCALLAIIGLANVFFNTFGFLRHRKREFAQYMSIGLTPAQMGKIFRIEAFLIAGKPLLVTLPLTVLFVEFACSASYLDSRIFWNEAPYLPVLLFAVAIVGFVSLAYHIGSKTILQCNLNETLRNDALM